MILTGAIFVIGGFIGYTIGWVRGHWHGVEETEYRWSCAVSKLDDKYDYSKQFEAQYDTNRKDSNTH
jgi:hypothetical protein